MFFCFLKSCILNFYKIMKIMKKVINLIILILAMQSVLAAQVIDAGKIERNLRQLDRKIVAAQALARQYDNPRAINLLQKARGELSAAYNFFSRAKNARPSERIPLLIKARNRFRIAESIVGQVTRLLLLKPAAQIRTELDRLIHQADLKLSQQSFNQESRYFLQKARAFLEKANKDFQDNRFLRGHENLRVARYFAEKALEFARAPDGQGGSGGDYESWFKNLKILLSRVTVKGSEKGVNAELYNNAQTFMRKAEENYKRGNTRQALTQLKLAERLVYRLIDMDESARDSGRQLQTNLQSLSQYLRSVYNEARTEDTRGMRWLKKAEQLYRAAQNDYDKKRYKSARRNINLSQRLALKAYGSFTQTGREAGEQETLKRRFDDIQALITLQEQRLKSGKNSQMQSLHEQGRALFRAAEKSWQQGDHVRARYQLNLSLRLLNRVERLSRAPETADMDAAAFEQDLQRLRNIVRRFQQNNAVSAPNKIKINTLDKLLSQAQKQADRGERIAAREMLTVVQNQIRHLLDSE